MAMPNLHRPTAGAFLIVVLATVLGLATNHVRPNGLPLVRKPLRETRATVTIAQLLQDTRQPAERSKPASPPHKQNQPPLPPHSEEQAVQRPSADVPPAPGNKQQDRRKAAPAQQERPAEAPTRDAATPPGEKQEALFTTLEEAKACYDQGTAIFIDSRPVEDFEAEHISGALNLYYEDLDQDYESVLGDVPKDKVIITFCSDPECASAIALADGLVAKGHKRTVILLEGLPGWKDAGYPTSSGKDTE